MKQAYYEEKHLFILCISVLFSCTKKEDFFDPHHIDEEAKENFPVKDIDPSQDWNMAAVGTLSVSINQKTGEVYTVKVYTDNPLNSEGNARLLAKKTGVRDGETVLFTFDVPKAIESVYVLFEDKMYNGWVKVADMKVGRPRFLGKSKEVRQEREALWQEAVGITRCLMRRIS